MGSLIGKAIDGATNAVLGSVTKATLEFCNEDGKVLKSMQCGFNPTDYSISHSISYRKSNGFGKPFDVKNLQFGRGESARLSVTIFVDEKSNLEGTLVDLGGKIYNAVKYRGFSSKPKNVKEICQFLEEFMHYDSKEKTTPLIGFNWGDMRFIGKLCSINVQFVMFDRNGNPTRAKIGMQIVGEDSHFMKKNLASGSSLGSSGASAARDAAKSLGKLNPRSLI